MDSTTGAQMMLGIMIFICVIAVYFLPTIIASKKHKKNTAAICLVNTVFGFTFIGWMIALVWAVTED